MKIVTKIILGSALFGLLLLGVLIHHVVVVRGMASATERLSAVQLSAATTIVEQVRTIDELEEHASKFIVTQDPAYLDRLDELRQTFGRRLRRLAALRAPEQEPVETDRLAALWAASPLSADSPDELAARLGPEDPDRGLALWGERFGQLRRQARRVLDATQAAIVEQGERAAAEAGRTVAIAWVLAAGTLALGLLVGGMIIRSINEPLGRLAEATQAVAEGRFSHEVPTSGSDELSGLGQHFNAMVQRLGELDRTKQEFLSRVSHELKTPIVTILETNQLLLDRIPGSLNTKQQRLLELTQESCRRLSGSITKLLDLSRMNASDIRYRFEDVDLASVVGRTVTRFEGLGRERGIDIEERTAPETIDCRCDPERMAQVVENLLENALKFSPRGSTVRVELWSGSEVAARLPPSWRQRGSFLPETAAMLTIADAGAGVPDDQKSRIFEKFHQVDGDQVSGGKGVGLGLAMCREIVEAHHGAIWVEDNHPTGSVFYLVLPAAGVGALEEREDRARVLEQGHGESARPEPAWHGLRHDH